MLRSLVPLVITLVVGATPATGVAATPDASTRRCNDPAFASGELTVRGVSCRTGARIIRRALARPGCTPTKEDAESHRGCYGATRVGKWRCTGLFPGEGFDLRCRSGKRRIHGGAGG